jgi:hypothetical protein
LKTDTDGPTIIFYTALTNIQTLVIHSTPLRSGEYEFYYLDHEGYDNSSDWAMRLIMHTSHFYEKNSFLRNVNFSKNINATLVNLIPRIEQKTGKFYIDYTYYEKGFKHNSRMVNVAIGLKFSFYGAFFEYLNQTIFYHLDDVSFFHSENRQSFLKDYTNILYSLLTQVDNNHRIRILYYVPIGMFEKINPKFLWMVLDETLKGFVNNVGTDTEDVVLHILKGLSKSTSNSEFLDELLLNNRILNLIASVDGENFEILMRLFWSKWKNSTFANIDQEVNKIITENSPVILDYRSDKTMGFHRDNAKIKWNEKTNIIDVQVTKDTGVFETTTEDNGRGGVEYVTTEITETFEYSYHPFAPIVIFSAYNPHFILKENNEDGEPYQLMPAFVLYANDEKKFWENWLKAGEYAFDIITTFSGVLNILKFGRLYKVLQAGKNLAGKGRIFTKAVTGVKGVAGIAEISAGSVNILLKLTGIADTELGREISKYLFYFEMIALSGELSLALYEKLQKSAKAILVKEKVLKESAKNADEAKQVEELIEELYKIAGMASKKQLRLWKTNVKDGKFNCANCAMAVDRTLGGNTASALPWTYRKVIKNGKEVDEISYNYGTDLRVLEKEYGKKFIKNMTPDKIKQMLKPGQRGIVFGYINGRDMGHVFNVVNENGVIKFLDGQKAVKSTTDKQKADLIYDVYEFLPTNF